MLPCMHAPFGAVGSSHNWACVTDRHHIAAACSLNVLELVYSSMVGDARITVMKYFDTKPSKEQMEPFTYRLLKSWHKTLCEYETKWIDIMEKERRLEDNYLPYVYNEQAQTAILAISAHRIGGFPFVEFNQDKYTHSGKGQQDLEIISTGDEIWCIEAKYLEIDQKESNLETRLKNKIVSAISDVEDLKNREVGKGVAIVFFRPYGYKEGREHEAFVKQIMGLQNKSIGYDFLAYHLCQRDILMKSRHRDSPGIAILGKCVLNRSRR